MNLVRRLFFAVSLAAPLIGLASGGSAAGSPSFLVDTTVDAVDASPGDGVCATAAGDCTLRAAVQETNALPGGDTITLPAATYLLQIRGAGEEAAATGDLDVTGDLEIAGAGAADSIIAGGLYSGHVLLGDRALDVHAGKTVLISGLAVQAGGHGLSSGGGISNQGTLTVDRSIVRDNQANSGAGVLNTGGVLTVKNSSFIGNQGPHSLAAGAGILNRAAAR